MLASRTKSRSLRVSVSPRTTRAYRDQKAPPRMITMFMSLGPKMTAMKTAKVTEGFASHASVTRMMT